LSEKKKDPLMPSMSEGVLHFSLDDLEKVFVSQRQFGEYTTKLAEKLGNIEKNVEKSVGTVKGLKWLTILVLVTIVVNIIIGFLR
jgi:hypothetical protein